MINDVKRARQLHHLRFRYIVQLVVVLIAPVLGLAVAQRFPAESWLYFAITVLVLIASFIALKFAGPINNKSGRTPQQMEFRYKEVDNATAVTVLGGFAVFFAGFVIIGISPENEFWLQLVSVGVLSLGLSVRTMCQAFIAELKLPA